MAEKKDALHKAVMRVVNVGMSRFGAQDWRDGEPDAHKLVNDIIATVKGGQEPSKAPPVNDIVRRLEEGETGRVVDADALLALGILHIDNRAQVGRSLYRMRGDYRVYGGLGDAAVIDPISTSMDACDRVQAIVLPCCWMSIESVSPLGQDPLFRCRMFVRPHGREFHCCGSSMAAAWSIAMLRVSEWRRAGGSE